jgi:hypothetical protein
METKTDSKGNIYIEVGNLRISYIEQKNRSSLKDWPNADVLRIQAYRGEGNALHQGAEYPVENEKSIYNLFEAFSKLMNDK